MSSKYSTAGRARLAAFTALFFANLIVLALSARVNVFQDFFFIADLFPLGLSITTLILLVITFALDFSLFNAFTARPPFDIGMLAVLSVLWLACNSFSTSRWRFVPLMCSNIPDEFSDEKVWCRDVQALKAFVWIEWVILLVTLVSTLRYVVTQRARGNKHIWSTALSRYRPISLANTSRETLRDPFGHASSFWEEKSFRAYSTLN